MDQIKELEVLQLHYYLSEHSHSMDAKIYNNVESELLKVIDEVARILDLEISIEIQALSFLFNPDHSKSNISISFNK